MFKFRFETLLKVKKIHEEKALQEFAAAQRTVKDLEDRRQARVAEQAATSKEFISRMDQSITAGEAVDFQTYLMHLEITIGDLEIQLRQARITEDEARQTLLKAKTESKAMNRLKQIERDRYIKEQNRLEMQFIDEIAITRHGKEL